MPDYTPFEIRNDAGTVKTVPGHRLHVWLEQGWTLADQAEDDAPKSKPTPRKRKARKKTTLIDDTDED